jgi:hypothetical protein
MELKMTQETELFRVVHIGKDGKVTDSNIDIDYYDNNSNIAKASYGGYLGRRFDNFEGNISVKSDYNRSDYEWFRAKTLHASSTQQMVIAQKAYDKVGMVRNIIDMMGEFTMQGVRIEHPNPKKQRFLQEWFDYVQGPMISERLANMLYRLGAAPVQAAYGTISLPNEEKMSVSQGQLTDIEYEALKPQKREIPLKYTFIPPWNIEIIGGELELFIGKPFYAIKIPTAIATQLSQANKIKDKELREALKTTLEKLKPIITKAGTYIYLNPKKFDIYFYKKDDWQVWPQPMIGAILDDLMLLEKMKLADASALDGAISNIRHWKVGIIDPSNPTNSILPTKAGINRIRQILSMSVGGGTMDLVTGPEVEFKESNTQVHKFLGTAKYESVLNGIYDGLGIPPPLRSNSSGSSNATNNYISLKTLIERLQYGRTILMSFWNKQLEVVQKALGHRKPGKLIFDNMILSDEAAEKKLLIELLDRDIISPDAVQRYFGFIPSLENPKINKAHTKRDSGNLPQKAGPFHNPQQDFEHKKTLLQNGDVAPSELGIELQPRKPGEEPRIDKMAKQKLAEKKVAAKFKPKIGGGRPKSVTETKKRKKKPNFRPQTGKAYLWAISAYNYVSDNLSHIILSTFGKKNFRQLTTAEFKEAEEFKFAVFAQLQPMSELTDINLFAGIHASRSSIINIFNKYEELKTEFLSQNNKEPNTEENRQLFILAYVEAKLTDF